ncbi:MAG: hypothetical protein H6732_05735 [Alphaproteobacteria bacterium]|nr:hypothetical protein [Alphaproteobacteria bacterium]
MGSGADDDARPAWERPLQLALLAYAAGVALAVLPTGYGTDADAYLMLRSWQELRADGVYVPSRFQGALPAELVLGQAASLAGALGSNAVVLATALLAGAALRSLMPHTAPRAWVLLACLLNPVVFEGSTTSMEYLPALAAFLGGLAALVQGRGAWGVLGLALAGATRLSYLPLGWLTWLWVAPGPPRRRAALALATTALTTLAYVPVWLASGRTFAFLGATRPTAQGLVGMVARFGHDTVMTFGLTALPFVALGLWRDRARLGAWRALPASLPGRLGLLLVVFHLALFAWIPVDRGYLIPLVAGVALLLGTLRARDALVAWSLGSLLYGAVSLEPLVLERAPAPEGVVCERGKVTGAHVAPHLEPGATWAALSPDEAFLRCLETERLRLAPDAVGGRLPVPPGP